MNRLIQRLEEALEEGTIKNFSAGDVTYFLDDMRTKTGGKLTRARYGLPGSIALGREGGWDAQATRVVRPDAFDYEDEPTWEEVYADPLVKEVEKKLDGQFGEGLFTVKISTTTARAFVVVSLTGKGKRKLPGHRKEPK